MATDIYQSYEYNYTPDRTRSPEKCLKILYTQLRNIGSRLSYDRMAQKFFGLPDALSCLTPSTVLGNRCGYMFAINDNVTIRSISVDKQAEIKFDYEQGVLGATIKGKGCAEEVRYVCQSDTHTFFVVKFGQGNCCLQLGWNETNKTTLVSTKSKPGAMITTSYVPSYTDNNSVSYSQESPFDSGSNSMQYEVYPAIAENSQELKECTNVLVLVSADNQRLWNTIYSAMKGQQVIKAYHDKIIVRLTLNPFNTIVVMALSYHEHNVGDVRVAVSCADNVIFYGNSSESYSYVLSAMTYRNNIFPFDDPFLNPQQWRQMTVDIKSICYKSASVLDVIKDHGRGKSYAFMMSNNDDYTIVPDTMKNQIIPRCKATPITPELYTCWKFTGLVGQTEEEYRRQVNEFIQRYGIPAVIDAVCRGCVAVIMHGPRWMWWYLTAFEDEISTAFGSDLRSITQIGVNNVAELMKRKDNARFRASLAQLRSRMIGHNVPVCIQHKLSIVFESGSKNSTLSCLHSNTFEAAVVVKPEPICKTSEMVKQAMEHYNKQLVDYYPQAIDLLAVARSDFVILLDEAGLPDDSKMPLKELHYHLDHPSFILCNRNLDATNTNGAVVRQLPPSLTQEDLYSLAKVITAEDESEHNRQLLMTLCSAFSKINNVAKEFCNNFFQHRDFINFLCFLRTHSALGQSTRLQLTPEQLISALERNFNSIPFNGFCKIVHLFIEEFNRFMVDKEALWDFDKIVSSLKNKKLQKIEESLVETVKPDENPCSAPFRYMMLRQPTDPAIPLLFLSTLKQNEEVCYVEFDDAKDEVQGDLICKVTQSITTVKTVPLLNVLPIATSVNDLFSRHFSKMPSADQSYNAYINVGSNSRPCVVHPNFKIVVHIPTSSMAATHLPFLDRFEKYRLSVRQVMEPELSKLSLQTFNCANTMKTDDHQRVMGIWKEIHFDDTWQSIEATLALDHLAKLHKEFESLRELWATVENVASKYNLFEETTEMMYKKLDEDGPMRRLLEKIKENELWNRRLREEFQLCKTADIYSKPNHHYQVPKRMIESRFEVDIRKLQREEIADIHRNHLVHHRVVIPHAFGAVSMNTGCLFPVAPLGGLGVINFGLFHSWSNCTALPVNIFIRQDATVLRRNSLVLPPTLVRTSDLEYDDDYIITLTLDLQERWLMWQQIRTYFGPSQSPRIIRLSNQSANMTRRSVLIQSLTIDQPFEYASTSQDPRSVPSEISDYQETC